MDDSPLPVKPAILADDERTWPNELIELLDRKLPALTDFHVTRAGIDRAAEKDVMLRVARPENPHERDWQQTLDAAQQIVSSTQIVGYHCTRLTAREQREILKTGMLPLSAELVKERVAAAIAAGEMTPELGQIIADTHKGSTNGRVGLLWWIFHRATLTDRFGVERLFRSWGGEAVYWGHEESSVGRQLRDIGMPCIVVGAIPAGDVHSYYEPGRRLVTHYLATRGVPVPDAREWEGNIRNSLSPPSILRIVTVDNPEFLALTDASKWLSKIR